MGKQGLGTLGMVLRGMNTATKGCPKYHRTVQPATGAVTHPAGMADNLLHARVDKTKKLKFGHRFQALSGHPDGGTGNEVFGQWRIHHPLEAKAVLQPHGGTEDPAIGGDILAQQDHSLIIRHGTVQGQVNGFNQGDIMGFGGGVRRIHASPPRYLSASCSRWAWSATGSVSNR